jgi:hypothetical protein
MPASTLKIARQPNTCSISPPKSGARIGATPITSTSRDNIRAAAAPECRSRTTARATTMPTAPPKACTARKAINMEMDDDSAQPSEPAT